MAPRQLRRSEARVKVRCDWLLENAALVANKEPVKSPEGVWPSPVRESVDFSLLTATH